VYHVFGAVYNPGRDEVDADISAGNLVVHRLPTNTMWSVVDIFRCRKPTFYRLSVFSKPPIEHNKVILLIINTD